jgi:transketolase
VRTAFIQALCEAAARDERVWLLTADLGYSVLEVFRDRFPKRYVNVGVAEQNLAGVAAGLARCGKVVFTYSIANFPTLRCLEQIRNDICYHEGDVKVTAVGGGFSYGSLGYTHHGVEDLAIMRSLPGMTVVAPGDPVETRLAATALVVHRGPAYLRLGKGREPVVHGPLSDFALGKAITVREGDDITLISTGAILPDVLAAAHALAQEGIQARVLSMHTLKPLDIDAIARAARETRAIVTVEEHRLTGGLGSAVADVLAEGALPQVAFRKLGVSDELYHEVGSAVYLRRLIGNVAETVRALIRKDRRRAA